MFYGTALGFDPVAPKAAYHQLMGDSKDSPIPDQYRTVETDPSKIQSPPAIASMGFTCLAGLLVLFAAREILIAIFSTIAFLDIGFLLAVLVLVAAVAVSFFRTFTAGGAFGLLPLLVLAGECLIVYLSYRFVVHRILDLENTPVAGGIRGGAVQQAHPRDGVPTARDGQR